MLVGSTIHNIINISVNAHILYELSGVVWCGVVRSVTENIVFHRHVCKSRCCDTMRFVKENVVLHSMHSILLYTIGIEWGMRREGMRREGEEN